MRKLKIMQTSGAKKPIIIFFGSGPVAAASLELLHSDFNIELVITKSKPLHHRGKAPVEELAKKMGLKISYANSKVQVDKALNTHNLLAELGLIIDYGVIVSANAIASFKYGIINSHFSLLPKWRGPDPITYAILAGDEETGVSLMKIVPKLEEGPIIAQEALKMPSSVDNPTLTNLLVKLSDQMLKKYIPAYLQGKIRPKPQPSTNVSYSQKITKADGIIDWSKKATDIERQIRAYAGWPKSRTRLGSLDCIITKAGVLNIQGKIGQYQVTNNKLIVFCGKQSLEIKRLQPAGKKEMSTHDFLLGYKNKL